MMPNTNTILMTAWTKTMSDYATNPEYAEERRINEYASESRKLNNGMIKENGRVLEPLSRDLDDIPDDLGENGTLG